MEIVTPGDSPPECERNIWVARASPRNPLLFSTLYCMKLVEQIGSGIRRIRDACLEHGVREPAIEVSPDWLTVTFLPPVSGARRASCDTPCNPSCDAPCGGSLRHCEGR